MADQQVDYEKALDYWQSTPATVDGVLGGFGNTVVPKVDIVGSQAFLRRLSTLSPNTFPNLSEQIGLDVGAGIGRITRNLLAKYCSQVDLLEPAAQFVAQARLELADLPQTIGFYEKGMQDFVFERQYAIVWCQWCLGQLPDEVLVDFLKKCAENLVPGGIIVAKENNSTTEDLYDDTDSAVTRTDASFRAIFENAGLRLLLTSVQKGMPRELFPVRMYALAPALKDREI